MALTGLHSTTTRDQLRREIEDTRMAFHQLLASVPSLPCLKTTTQPSRGRL